MVAIDQQGVLDSDDTLHDPLNSGIAEIHKKKDNFEKVSINPIISFTHFYFQGSKSFFPTFLLPKNITNLMSK